MSINEETIQKIDATLLPQLDRHHLRLLAHCLDSFRSMAGSTSRELPDAARRRIWCENQQVVAADPAFVETLLNQLASAAEQLEDLAREVGKQPLDLSLDDLIAAAESRCRN